MHRTGTYLISALPCVSSMNLGNSTSMSDSPSVKEVFNLSLSGTIQEVPDIERGLPCATDLVVGLPLYARMSPPFISEDTNLLFIGTE